MHLEATCIHKQIAKFLNLNQDLSTTCVITTQTKTLRIAFLSNPVHLCSHYAAAYRKHYHVIDWPERLFHGSYCTTGVTTSKNINFDSSICDKNLFLSRHRSTLKEIHHISLFLYISRKNTTMFCKNTKLYIIIIMI